MTSLREMQLAFAASLAGAAHSGVAIVGNGVAVQRRLDIYRNNTREGFLRALMTGFPVIFKLGGEDWFRQTGLSYMREHPSRSGNLHHVGEHFPTYLATCLAGTQHAYFADVAQLEWACQEVMLAAEAPLMDLHALAAVPQERYQDLRFLPHPALRLMESRYPVLAIWERNQPDSAQLAEPICLDAGASRVRVLRKADHIELCHLPPGEFALLAACLRGLNFSSAAESALQQDQHTDINAALMRSVTSGALVGFAFGE